MQVSTPVQVPDDGHAHHGSHKGVETPNPETGTQPESQARCCESGQHDCLSACLANSLSAANLSLAVLEPAIHTTHYNLVRAAQFLPGPSYPSLYRPPISHS